MKVAEYIEKCKKDIGWDSDAEHEWSDILHAVAFQERCAKDGILTYDRDCNELKALVKELDLQYIIDDIFHMQEQVEVPHRLKQGRKLEELKKFLEPKKTRMVNGTEIEIAESYDNMDDAIEGLRRND